MGDPRPHEETRHGDHPDILMGTRTGPRTQDVVEIVALVDITQRHEFRKTPGLALDLADQPHMGRDVPGTLDVAIHDGRSRGQADRMRGLDDLHPTCRHQLAGSEQIPDFIVENLGGRSRQTPDPRLHEPAQVVGQLHAALAMSPIDLFGRVGVKMQLREGGLDIGGQIVIVGMILLGVNASLHAEFGRTPIHRLLAFLEHGIDVVHVGVGLVLMARKAAEGTTHVADIREVEIATNHIADIVSDILPTGAISGPEQGEEVRTLRSQKPSRIFDTDFPALECAIQDRGHSGIHIFMHFFKHQAAASLDWWWGRRA